MRMEGVLRLEFASRDGVTAIADRYQEAPLQVQKVLHPNAAHPGMAWVYVLTVTGGIVQGDQLQTEIIARDEAQVHVTTPAATTRATLVYGSILSPGRVAMGEAHAYDLYVSRVTAQRPDGALEFLDVTHLAPAAMSPTHPGLLGRFDALGTLHVWTSSIPPRDLSDRLHRVLQDRGDLLGGASELPSGRGVTVRMVGPRLETVAAALAAVVATARAAILGVAEKAS